MADWYSSQNPNIQSGWYDEGRLVSTNPNDPNFTMSFQQKQAAQRAQDLQRLGVGEYTGPISFGERAGIGGGENSLWGMLNGQEVPVLKSGENAVAGGGAFFTLNDLMQKYGSMDAIRASQGTEGLNFDVAGWGTRPGNDAFSGKEGLQDLGTIALMAAPVVGAALAPAAAAGTTAATAGGAGAGGTVGAAGAAGGSLLDAGLAAAGLSPEAAAATTSGLAAGGPLAGGSAALLSSGGGGSGAVDVGSGMGVDEFGNVSRAGAGGATSLGGGLGVDEFGNVSGGESAGGGGTGGAGAPSLLSSPLTMSALSAGIPAAIGALGAGSQANAYSNLAGQYMAMGAPYRSRLSDLYNDPDEFLNSKEVQIPIQQATNILARSLSRGGNPTGSGNALQELQNYASNLLFGRLGQEKDRLAGFGGLTAYNNAAPNMASQAIGSQKGIWDALGAGTADILNPRQRYTLQDLMR